MSVHTPDSLLWPEFSPLDFRIDRALDQWFGEHEKHTRSFPLRLEDGQEGCSLFLMAPRGVRLITVPGAHERDFRFYGGRGTTIGGYASFVRDAVDATDADHIALPLLSRFTADALVAELSARLPDFRFHANLAAVSPVIAKNTGGNGVRPNLRKILELPHRRGWRVRSLDALPSGVEELHSSAWGSNRSASFFDMLSFFAAQDFSDAIGVFDRHGDLLALQINLRTSQTYHYYYHARAQDVDGAGSAVFGLSYERFLNDDRMRSFSFGRGSERYKYRWANQVSEAFEVRGFYVPSTTGSVGRDR